MQGGVPFCGRSGQGAAGVRTLQPEKHTRRLNLLSIDSDLHRMLPAALFSGLA